MEARRSKAEKRWNVTPLGLTHLAEEVATNGTNGGAGRGIDSRVFVPFVVSASANGVARRVVPEMWARLDDPAARVGQILPLA